MKTITRSLSVTAALVLALLGVITTPGQAYAAPAPATITINNTRVVDGVTTPIEGGEYTATKIATIDPATGARTDAAGGTVTIPEGTPTALDQYSVYSVVQTTRAPGYPLNTQPFTVELPLMSGGQVQASQDLVVNPKLVPVTGDATLVKYANDTTTPLAGATFALYRDTTVLPGAQLGQIGTLTTDAAGRITATGLTEGTYHLVETVAPTGYALDNQQYPFSVTVNADGTAAVVNQPAAAQNYTRPSATTVSKNVTPQTANVGSQVTYTITVDVPLDIASYASYVVTDTLDSRYTVGTPATTAAGVGLAVSGQTVTITLDPATVPPGSTNITIPVTVNTTAVGGDAVPNTANVAWDNGQGDSGSFSVSATLVTITEGSLAVTKLDGDAYNTAQGTPLAGAEFILTDSATSTTPLNGVDGQPYRATTDAQGNLTFSRLPYGTYFLREVTAPTGYRLPTSAQQVTVDGTNSAVSLTVSNFENANSNIPLPGTGTLGPLPYLAAGGVLLLIFFILWRRQRDDEDQPVEQQN